MNSGRIQKKDKSTALSRQFLTNDTIPKRRNETIKALKKGKIKQEVRKLIIESKIKALLKK